MNTPEDILKIQRSISVLHGTRKIAVCMIVVCCVLAFTEIAFDLAARANLFRSVGSWFGMILVGLLMNTACARKSRELIAQLEEKSA